LRLIFEGIIVGITVGLLKFVNLRSFFYTIVNMYTIITLKYINIYNIFDVGDKSWNYRI
jgi:hypothetical protein